MSMDSITCGAFTATPVDGKGTYELSCSRLPSWHETVKVTDFEVRTIIADLQKYLRTTGRVSLNIITEGTMRR